MNKPQPLAPHEAREVEAKRESSRNKQPYSSELDDREFEHAHNENRPIQPDVKATTPSKPSR